jgi:hypothetical protein
MPVKGVPSSRFSLKYIKVPHKCIKILTVILFQFIHKWLKFAKSEPRLLFAKSQAPEG